MWSPPKWTQYVAEAGEFEVAIGDNMTYTIRGHMKGGSIQDGGSIMENEAGVAFAFTGRLLISDYSEDYETRMIRILRMIPHPKCLR